MKFMEIGRKKVTFRKFLKIIFSQVLRSADRLQICREPVLGVFGEWLDLANKCEGSADLRIIWIREAITEEKQLFYGHLPQGGGGLTNSVPFGVILVCVWKLLTYYILC